MTNKRKNKQKSGASVKKSKRGHTECTPSQEEVMSDSSTGSMASDYEDENLPGNVPDLLKVLNGQLKGIHDEMKKMRHTQKSLNLKFDEIDATVVTLKNDTQKNSGEIASIKGNVDFKFDQQSTMMKMLSDQANNLERQSRRYNLRLLGILEKKDEDPTAIVQHILTNKLNMPHVEIETAYRTGKIDNANSRGKPRHIIFKLRLQDKHEILRRKRRALSGTDILIVEDATPADMELKRKLQPVINRAKEEGKLWKFRNGKLIIEGRLYTDKENYSHREGLDVKPNNDGADRKTPQTSSYKAPVNAVSKMNHQKNMNQNNISNKSQHQFTFQQETLAVNSNKPASNDMHQQSVAPNQVPLPHATAQRNQQKNIIQNNIPNKNQHQFTFQQDAPGLNSKKPSPNNMYQQSVAPNQVPLPHVQGNCVPQNNSFVAAVTCNLPVPEMHIQQGPIHPPNQGHVQQQQTGSSHCQQEWAVNQQTDSVMAQQRLHPPPQQQHIAMQDNGLHPQQQWAQQQSGLGQIWSDNGSTQNGPTAAVPGGDISAQLTYTQL
jgi:hypothetical protein